MRYVGIMLYVKLIGAALLSAASYQLCGTHSLRLYPDSRYVSRLVHFDAEC